MESTLQITFRGLEHSDAVKQHLHEKFEKLQQFCKSIVRCEVVLEMENKNQQTGNLHHVRITTTVPGKQLVSTHNEDVNLYVAIQHAFEDMTRQLEDYVRHLNDAHNQQPALSGKVIRLFNEDGFGFIDGQDGAEFYFNAAHTATAFDQLSIGAVVHFVREESPQWLEARRVRLTSEGGEEA